jgi:uncharacterized protein YycO
MKIVFSASDTLGGALIRFGTRSDWNHVDLLFEDGTLIGSSGKGHGVEKMSLNERLSDKYRIVRYRIDEITLPDEAAARRFAEEQVGKKYDYTAVIAFLLPWRENWNVKRKWFCSELAAAAIHAGGVKIARMDQWRVTPNFLDINPLLTTVFGPADIPEPFPTK